LARLLAIDWDQQQLQIVAASVRRGSVQITRAVARQEEKSPNLVDAAALGALLRERLKEEKIAPAPVLMCVGRDRVILKEVRYPSVPAAEEPAVVRFQAVKELTDAPDEVVIDYVGAGEQNGNGERRAFALALRRELLETYQVLCRAAGLKLLAVTPRPFAALACLESAFAAATGPQPPEPADAAIAIVTATDRWAELCVARQGRLLLARHLSIGNTLPGEIRRSLVVQGGQQPQNPVRAVCLAGDDETGSLRQRLQALLSLPVHEFDPLSGAESTSVGSRFRGAFTGPVGLLQAWAKGGILPVNFAHPKEPQAAHDPNRNRLIIAAAAIAAVFLGGIVYGYMQLAAKDREFSALTLQKIKLDNEIVLIDEDAKRIKAIGEWEDGSVVWLDELYDLVERFPSNLNGIRLAGLTAEPMVHGAKEMHIARMQLRGVTIAQPDVIDTFEARLQEEKYHLVLDKSTNRNPDRLERGRFPVTFTTRVEIEKRPPGDYSLQLHLDEDDQRGRGRGRGADDFMEGGLP